MLDTLIATLVTHTTAFPAFAQYFGACLVALLAFVLLYTLITPQNEFALIRVGNTAAAISFAGALIGFVLPLASVMIHAHGLVDLAIWSAIGLVVQLLAFVLAAVILVGVSDIRARIRERFDVNDVAAGTFLGVFSLIIGILNAAAMV